jgi:long-chain acyl-CoA synthetase
MQFGISEAVLHWAKYRKDQIAAYSDGEAMSYDQLNRWADRIAFLIDHQCQGERLALALRGKSTMLASIIATLRVGRVPVLLNIGLPLSTLAANLSDAKPTHILHDDSSCAIAGLLPESSRIRVDSASSGQRISDSQRANKLPDDEWGIFFSSGTTGTPKGIVRDHDSVTTELVGWCLELTLSRSTHFYIGRPVFYTGGLVLTLATLLVGGTVHISNYIDDNDMREVWRDYQHTASKFNLDYAFFVPDQIRAFLRMDQERVDPIRSARSVLIMGSSIKGSEKRQFADVMHCEVRESWGNSESLGTITDAADLFDRPDSVGRPFLCDEMCIVDEEDHEAGPSQMGRIAGSEEAGFSEYCNRTSETSRVKRERLIISEDLGFIDAAGYFYVRGRVQDSVVKGSKTIYLPDVEHAIRNLPEIAECRIVTLNDSEDDVCFGAAIVLRPACEPTDDMTSVLNKNLEADYHIKHVLIVDRLPRLPSGKPDVLTIRNLVRQLAQEMN